MPLAESVLATSVQFPPPLGLATFVGNTFRLRFTFWADAGPEAAASAAAPRRMIAKRIVFISRTSKRKNRTCPQCWGRSDRTCATKKDCREGRKVPKPRRIEHANVRAGSLAWATIYRRRRSRANEFPEKLVRKWRTG